MLQPVNAESETQLSCYRFLLLLIVPVNAKCLTHSRGALQYWQGPCHAEGLARMLFMHLRQAVGMSKTLPRCDRAVRHHA